jgi:hypothetical protein
MTGAKSNYDIPNGCTFPLLASFRALVSYEGKGQAPWTSTAFGFVDDHGPGLVQVLIEQINTLAGILHLALKNRGVYISLHDRAKLLIAEANQSRLGFDGGACGRTSAHGLLFVRIFDAGYRRRRPVASESVASGA